MLESDTVFARDRSRTLLPNGRSRRTAADYFPVLCVHYGARVATLSPHLLSDVSAFIQVVVLIGAPFECKKKK